jgi:hypothetical protein
LPLVETMGLLAGEGLQAYVYWASDAARATVKANDQLPRE